MIIICPNCQSKYRFDEAKLGSRPRARTRCNKCGGSIEIENPLTGSETLPPEDFSPPPPPPPPAPQAPAPSIDEKLKTQRQPIPTEQPAEAGQTITGQDLHKMGVLELPHDKRFSLAVIQGPATGQIFQITKTRTTMGRSGCDVNLNDPEASRQHLHRLGAHRARAAQQPHRVPRRRSHAHADHHRGRIEGISILPGVPSQRRRALYADGYIATLRSRA
jgi:predicted Zn finger-like uncharacterized protein